MEILQSLLNPVVIWFIIGLVFFLLELGAPGLVLLFFGMGAWIVALLTLIAGIELDLQLLIFVVSSVILLLLLRRKFQKLFKGKLLSSGTDVSGDLVGETGLVTDSIIPPKKGKVEIHGTEWSAESEIEILSGSTVEIIARKNLTLKVKSL
jgi:membrane protein implicated in regulation of membrane protease activity